MWCRSGCVPVAIELRQTGVSDGNVDTARRYSPCSARNRSAGVSAASNTDGVSPSTMTRTTGFGSPQSLASERSPAWRSGARERRRAPSAGTARASRYPSTGTNASATPDERGEREQ